MGFINDLMNISKCETKLFADDTVLLLNNADLKSLYDIVNLELAAVANWSKINKLSLNHSKTQYVLIQPTKKQPVGLSYDFCVNSKGTKINCVALADILG